MPSPSGDDYPDHVARILVVDDDATVRGVVVDYLHAAGHEVDQAGDGQSGLAAALDPGVDLVILDLMLPGLDGLEVFRRLRSGGVEAPVIMLTAKDSESDRILGLELGADDYLTKPFSPRELVLRVGSVLRRAVPPSADGGEIVDGDLRVDLAARKATLRGEQLVLTLREFDLLAYLITHPDRVVSRDDLMGAVWDWQHGDSATVTVHVRRLRGKIEDDPSEPTRLVTVWGRGYRWEPAS